MSLIPTPANIADAPARSQPLLEAVNRQLGTVPNLYRLVANSPATLQGLLGLHGALAGGTLPARAREALAIAIAQANGCDYCLSAHSYIAANMLKVDAAEIEANRAGRSSDAMTAAAIRFALDMVAKRGRASEADLAALRAAGYDNAAALEIVGHVVLNIFTNYLNIAFDTDIDFPVVTALAA